MLENPLWAAIVLAIALATTTLLGRFAGPAPAANRFVAIDGLRGYLAFGVFLHHAAIWFQYLRSGLWVLPKTPLYTHLGQSGVAFFFMITAFLFTTKLRGSSDRPIDWRAFFVARVMRLTPLYLLAMILLAAVVALATDFRLQVMPVELLREFGIWLGFSILGEPDLNALPGTRHVLAGVTWSLPFEWFFYCALPLMAMSTRSRPRLGLALFSATACTLFLLQGRTNWLAYEAFLIGTLAAFPAQSSTMQNRLGGTAGACVALTCLVLAVLLTPTPSNRLGLLLIGISFVIVACGNTLFGALGSALSRRLGEVSYSLYLLHGVILYVAFRFVIGDEAARHLSPAQHWLVVMACTPLLMAVCFVTFRTIEAPGMRLATPVAAWLARQQTRSTVDRKEPAAKADS